VAGSRAAQGGGPVQVDFTLDPESLRNIMHMAKQVDPVLKRTVYKRLRAAGDVAAQAARDAVTGTLPEKADNRSKTQRLRRKPRPQARATSDGSLRAGIAKGVRVGLGTGAKSKGIRITSSDRYLPDSKKAMNRVYRLRSFRHMVFGDREVWVDQHGKDWFYSPIEQRRAEFTTAVAAALAEAAETLGNAQ
jgi:hypothetical protein